MASFTAAGTSYATHGEPMIPIYIFYSMFGFQRTGDGLWAAADQMARGFVLGATAGRTTLTGEGLQHADGHSLLLAATNPAVVAYDPAFAFEIALHRARAGCAGCTAETTPGEHLSTTSPIYNEPYVQPAEPEDLDVEGLLRGIYRYRRRAASDGPHVAQILASGVAMPGALQAARLLAEEWGVAADVWSVTSWGELRRDGVAIEKRNLRAPRTHAPRVPYVTQALADAAGPVVAVSDWMRAVPDQIRPWVPAPTSRWAPTGSASPTPAPRRAATSTSTPSRSWWRCSRRSRPRGHWTGRWRSRPPRSTASTIRRRPVRRRATPASPERRTARTRGVSGSSERTSALSGVDNARSGPRPSPDTGQIHRSLALGKSARD